MALETILSSDGFQLAWENSADFLHLVCHHPQLETPLGISLDAQERQDFLEIVRSAQRMQTQSLEQSHRLGALPARPARLRLALAPGPRLVVEAILAGRQLFEVSLESRSAVRALVHLLIQQPDSTTRRIEATLGEREQDRVQLGGQWGVWREPHSHVLGPAGEWLPLAELPAGQALRGWLNPNGNWERLSLDAGAPAGPDRLVERGLFEQAEAAYGVMEANQAKQELGRAYLAVQRGPLLEALPHLQVARSLSGELSEEDENLLLELETYLLCQQGTDKASLIVQNMQKLVARQVTRDRWAARRALSNWWVLLDLLWDGQVPALPLQVWQSWLAQIPSPIMLPTLSFARPAAWSRPAEKPARVLPARVLPPERSQLAPLIAILLALLLGFWWRWKHPVQWSTQPTAPVTGSAR
ncbi:MAG: hypothetical protein KF760_22275 [Candidatus Eremiobacteraeota bacterium]|nr:hypothetical protein [Candidatus Eremiobacteraeota bacterium]MCW5866447.1 hypothetical protein [Candidatus Eremiobacteraeota bacterium]